MKQHGFLLCLAIAISLAAPQQAEPIVKDDIEEIRTIVTDLLASGVHINLEQHQTRFVDGDTENLIIENFLFASEDGLVFTVTSERVLDKNYQPKVVSYFDVTDDDAQKVLLSLLGGGNIKTLTINKK
ncbi:uncharacterized protein LOC121590357 [Anopheles merus]|uniref:Uncharacterized protein n=1 Tax=Anopheles merus TaxID=30066 RepID=A0A182VF44_ANOME|nr:uncharacterized protein LOC121590357 [Anopheles merus]